MVFGEVTSNAHVDYQTCVRDAIKAIGYDDSSQGNCYFNYRQPFAFCVSYCQKFCIH